MKLVFQKKIAMKRKIYLFALLGLFLAATACQDDEETMPVVKPAESCSRGRRFTRFGKTKSIHLPLEHRKTRVHLQIFSDNRQFFTEKDEHRIHLYQNNNKAKGRVLLQKPLKSYGRDYDNPKNRHPVL